jgi:hypothetical protein
MFISQSVKLISDNIWIALVLWHRLDVYNEKLSIHNKCAWVGKHQWLWKVHNGSVLSIQTSSSVNIQLTCYLEFDGTMDKICVNRSSTQEELRKYRKCSMFNEERETTRAKFWRAKTSIAKFPLLLQLLNKSNIFSNLSKLRNYTSSLIKIDFRQIIQ